MNKLTLEDLDLAGKKVLTRVDYNVPLSDGRITDDHRVRQTLPTVKAIVEGGGIAVLMSHLGRPKGKVAEELRLTPVAACLQELIGRPVKKTDTVVGEDAARAVQDAKPGDIVLLENLRFEAGETACDDDFVRKLTAFGDVYVNDAFGAAHRAHASVVGPPRTLKAAAGFLMQKELEYFGKLLESPDRPYVAILGGAKVSDKIAVIEKLLESVDRILVGGAMAYTFLAAQGKAVGASRVEEDRLDVARETLEKAKAAGVTLELPSDHVVASEFSAASTPGVVEEIPEGKMGLDIGPKSIERYREVIAGAKTVVWNGPMGVFEWESFRKGTEAVARAMAESSATTVVGGGDSAAAIRLLGFDERVSHVSTGGGASLEMLEGKTLPGVEALTDR
ncbi:MAG: phosphoglycerate kinase [Planctomycetota bacterium]